MKPTPFEQVLEVIRHDDPRLLRDVLRRVSIDARDQDGLSLAQAAIRIAAPRALRLLLERGAPLEPDLEISAAIVCGEIEPVRALPRAELDRVDRLGSTPLRVATGARELAIVELLLRRGADPEVRDRWGATILHTATKGCDLRVVELLLRRGANVHAEDIHGHTPLVNLLWSGLEQVSPAHLACARLLLRAGARLRYRSEVGVGALQKPERCVLCNVAGAYFGFSPGHASALALVLEWGGPDLLRARGGPALCDAVIRGNAAAVAQLLDAGVSPNTQNGDGRSVVWLAVRFKKAEVLAKLLERGARVPAMKKGGRALLVEARAAEDPRLAELLAPYDVPGAYPTSPAGLRDAIVAGELAAVERLLDAGVDANAEIPERGGATPAILAAGEGRAEILRALAAHGADIDRPCSWTVPLEAAITRRHLACVRTLIELGCDVNAEPPGASCSLLWRAALTCELDIVRLLLAAGADPHRNPSGRPRREHRSAEHGFDETMDVLLSAMCDPVRRRATLQSALRDALYAQAHDEIRYYLERAPELRDAPNEIGERPIEIAAKRGDAELLRFLLSLGPCTLTGDDHGTPLASAVLKGTLDAVRVLVEAGADVNGRRPGGLTPVMYACYLTHLREYPEIVELLLDHGADVDARTGDSKTALLLAVESGLYGVIAALLRRRPDLSVRDPQGRSAFDLAHERGDPEVIDLLASTIGREPAK